MFKLKLNNRYWENVELTPQQEAIAMLLDIMIIRCKETGKLTIVHILDPDFGVAADQHVRPLNAKSGQSHVLVDTFEECIELFADPAKFDGRWGD